MMIRHCFSRRMFLYAAGAAAFAARPAFANEMLKEISQLKPGEFTWHPERSESGPVSVVVSIPEQRVHVYRNGVRDRGLDLFDREAGTRNAHRRFRRARKGQEPPLLDL
ncbi:hypothetical protein WOA01_13095 [Methylocystis sp. IM2]|uniref:hypothetical protein n=1 Tax=Methylocystis sp. IM2 TaxID=3136563 RepID=UPI0030FB3097